jgi:[ribosomal protein S5]-alanine N-acetyltransferase
VAVFGFPKKQWPVLSGELTQLRLPVAADYADWQKLRELSVAELRLFEPRWSPSEFSPAAFGLRVKQAKIYAKSGEAFQFLIFSKNATTLLGGITLGNIRRGAAQTGEIGYWLGTIYCGQGFMRDAVKTLLSYAFSVLHLHRVQAGCISNNARSIALLRHCGFRYEGIARAFLEINGRRQDHHLYACLPSDIA